MEAFIKCLTFSLLQLSGPGERVRGPMLVMTKGCLFGQIVLL